MGESPIWLSNAPAKFQRYMKNYLTDVRDKPAFPYLGDVLVYPDDFNLHVDHLRKVYLSQIKKMQNYFKSRSII